MYNIKFHLLGRIQLRIGSKSSNYVLGHEALKELKTLHNSIVTWACLCFDISNGTFSDTGGWPSWDRESLMILFNIWEFRDRYK